MVNSRRRILCVDDDADTCDLLSTWLTQLDYEVETAPTLASAFELVGEEAFDLYMLDIRFPDGSGLDFCRQIRETDASTPIIFCSGDARANTMKQAFEAGATEFLTKPVNLAELAQTIEQLTCGKRRLNPSYRTLIV